MTSFVYLLTEGVHEVAFLGKKPAGPPGRQCSACPDRFSPRGECLVCDAALAR